MNIGKIVSTVQSEPLEELLTEEFLRETIVPPAVISETTEQDVYEALKVPNLV